MSLSHALALTVAAALIAPIAPPVLAQDGTNDIVVTAPRHGKRSPSGEATETVSHAIRVSTAGLDLSTPAGLQALEPRVRKAAQTSCKWLDAHYPVVDREDDCESAAVSDAMARARARGGAG